MECRQFPVGVIQMCCMEPGPLISATVNVVFDLMRTLGLTFQPCPKSREALEPVPSVAMPPLPFSPVKFSGEMDLLFASESLKRFDMLDSMPLNF